MALCNWSQEALKRRENAVEEELVYGAPPPARVALLEAEFAAIEDELERRAARRIPTYWSATLGRYVTVPDRDGCPACGGDTRGGNCSPLFDEEGLCADCGERRYEREQTEAAVRRRAAWPA